MYVFYWIGLVNKDGCWAPKVAGYEHWRYSTPDRELAKMMRDTLVESYVRYNSRFPENGNTFPHSSIHKY